MKDQAADPGQVAPGTQREIERFFVVSKMVSQPQVGEYSPTKLSDLFVGTRESQHFSGDMESEYAIFTDRTSADNYAKKQRLLYTGIGFLKRLSVEQLEEIVNDMIVLWQA